MTGWRWLRAVLSTPSRLAALVVVATSLVVAGVYPDAATHGGWVEATQFAGGLVVLGVIVGWRRFWRGPGVVRTFLRQQQP